MTKKFMETRNSESSSLPTAFEFRHNVAFSSVAVRSIIRLDITRPIDTIKALNVNFCQATIYYFHSLHIFEREIKVCKFIKIYRFHIVLIAPSY